MSFPESGKAAPAISVRSTVLYGAAALLVALISLYLGQSEFGGYDSSMLVDAGWRMALHQHPYRDFPTLLPPLFLLSAGASVRIFGDHWRAFSLGEDCLYLLIAAAGWGLVRLSGAVLTQRIRGQLLAVFLVAISLPHLVTVHLWHAVDTSMLATTLLLAFTLRALASGQDAPPSRWTFDAVVVAVSAVLWLGKPNIAVLAHAVTMFFASYSNRKLRDLLFWVRTVVLGAASSALLLLLCGIKPWSVAHSYTKISGRPDPGSLLGLFTALDVPASTHIDSILGYTFVLVVPVCLLGGMWLHRANPLMRAGIPLVLAGCALTVCGMLTDWDVRSNDIAPLFFAAAFTTISLFPALEQRQLVLRTVLLVLLAECVVLIGFDAEHRTRMRSVGQWAGIRYGDLQTRTDPFFGRFAARQVFWDEVIDPIDRDVRRHPSAKVFFGMRLEFEYARLHLVSPTMLPVWWHAGSSYPVSIEDHLVDEWIAYRFDTLYLAGEDRLPARLIAEIGRRYDLVTPAKSTVAIFRRRSHAAGR